AVIPGVIELVEVVVAGAIPVNVGEPAALGVQDDVVELRVAGGAAVGDRVPVELDLIIVKERLAQVLRQVVKPERGAGTLAEVERLGTGQFQHLAAGEGTGRGGDHRPGYGRGPRLDAAVGQRAETRG